VVNTNGDVALVIYFILNFGELNSDLRIFVCICMAFIRYSSVSYFQESDVLSVSVE